MKLFLGKHIRAIYKGGANGWLYCVADVIKAVTGSKNPSRYWGGLKRKGKGIDRRVKIKRFEFKAKGGKSCLADFADGKQLLRIIKIIPSPKAECLKEWVELNGGDFDILPELVMVLTKYSMSDRLLRENGVLEETPAKTPQFAETAGFAETGESGERRGLPPFIFKFVYGVAYREEPAKNIYGAAAFRLPCAPAAFEKRGNTVLRAPPAQSPPRHIIDVPDNRAYRVGADFISARSHNGIYHISIIM